VVSEAPEVKLEALELETGGVRYVFDSNRPEVWCSALERLEFGCVRLHSAERTEGRELSAFHGDLVAAIGVWISERLQQFWTWHEQRMHEVRASVQIMHDLRNATEMESILAGAVK